MRYGQFLELLDGDTVAYADALLSEEDLEFDPDARKRLNEQLCRWTRAGRLARLRPGVYLVMPGHGGRRLALQSVVRYVDPAAAVSLQSALELRGIDCRRSEAGSALTCVTPGRTRSLQLPMGTIRLHHLRAQMWWGYDLEIGSVDFEPVRIARPEKALADLLSLSPKGERLEVLAGLGLRGISDLDLAELRRTLVECSSPRLAHTYPMVAMLWQRDSRRTRTPNEMARTVNWNAVQRRY